MDYSHIYPELSQTRGIRIAPPLEFPPVCPVCQAAKVTDTGADAWAHKRTAAYACGGAYTHKPQIQNHTDKWWGKCPRQPVK